MIKKTNLRVMLAVALTVIMPMLAACGGGGGGSPTPVAQSTTGIYGTVATGAGQPHPRIDFKDGTCKTSTCVGDGGGNFFCPTTGLTPPYLLRTTTTISTKPTVTLYSVSADTNASTTINITPLTDLIVRSWYRAQGIANVDMEFNNPCAHPRPSPAVVAHIHDLIKNVVQLWLDKNNVTNTDFNLISTPFTAGTISVPGTGFDKVLDQALINASTGSLVLSDGTTTQDTTLSTFLSSLTASTTTYSILTGTYVASGYNDTISVLVNPAEEAALSAITSVVTNLSDTINAKGTALQESDLLPYLDAGLLQDGRNQAQVAAKLVADNKGKTVAFSVESIKELDTTSIPNRAVVGIAGMGKTTFKKIGGSWVISGNDHIAFLELSLAMRNQQGNTCPTCSGVSLNVKVEAPQGMISSVTITGWSLWPSPTIVPSTNKPVSSPTGTLDRFWLSSGFLTQVPPKNTPFTVTLVSSGSGTVTYEMLSNAYTTESIYITSITDTTLATALGSSRTVTWTEPKTFAFSQYGRQLSYQAFTSTDICTGIGTIAGSSGTITLPTACGVNSIFQVSLGIYIRGLNGEFSNATWVFK